MPAEGEVMLRFYVSNKNASLQFEHGSGPLVLGREPRTGSARRALNDDYMSANQMCVEERPGGRMRLENLSKKVSIQAADGTVIGVGGACELALPTRLRVGATLIDVSAGEKDSDETTSLLTIARPVPRAGTWLGAAPAALAETPDLEQLTRWFEAVISVQRAAACSAEFYQEIARAVVELIGLDCGLVLLRRGDRWEAVARHAADGAPRVEFSRTVLGRVCEERRTFYQAADLADTARSLAGVTNVVASPVFDADGQGVLGAVYGAKMLRENVRASEIRPLHAQLVQVLAAAASAGIARVGSEAEAARRHVQFEQFFSRELAGELDRNPEMLAGHDREVTILVSDIRGFSRIAERLGPRATCDLMGDVLERLTARIHEQGGVVVDYVGDGIMAMWNAPVAQPDHPARACRAAVAMLGELTGLNARWAERIGATLALGIGVNTGEALVGNTGSRQRLKYGPLGNTVNLASRVEGATKQLGVPVLITGATRDGLGDGFATRRLCRVRAVGIDAPVDLHELHGGDAPDEWRKRRDTYEAGLALFERGQLSDACGALFPLLQGEPGRHDKSTLTLVARAVENLRSGSPAFDPVITLDAK